MNYVYAAVAVIYVAGFGLMFMVQASAGPVTLGLAVARAAAWLVSVALRDEWPRGERQQPGDVGPIDQ